MLPIGIIVIWHGSAATIPGGWSLCDGNNGTPDLRDRFIVGSGLTYDPADTGGSLTHIHTFTGDGHTHAIGAGSRIQSGIGRDDTSLSTPTTGTTDPTNHLPPYYALAYIMRT